MSTNYYLVYKQPFDFKYSLERGSVQDSFSIATTHIGKRSRGWAFQGYSENDVFDQAVEVGEVTSLAQWRDILTNIPDNVYVIDEVDMIVDPQELLDEWDELEPYSSLSEYWNRFQNPEVIRKNDNSYLDEECYLFHDGYWS